MKGEAVCVTGSSGFIGSWLVQLLLNRGYTVHATVQDLTVKGTAGVFHVASPNIIGKVQDPQKELLEPAINGTKNVTTAAKGVGAKRVVVTSSTAAIMPSPNWPADVPKSEACWTDEDYCRENELWYPLSKLRAEKAAWDIAAEKGVEVVVVNPATVLGPVLPPVLGSSMAAILGILQGSTETYANFHMGCVHVKDVAMSHILLFENKSAMGRHLCCKDISHFSDLAARVAELYPEYNVARFPKDTQPGLLRKENAGKKLMDLGLQFTSLDQIIKDSVESLKSKGYLS
ncbi:hypothetical protein BVRB_1g015100 isoform A [Beta vulgaris subsp. vulgaris]|nr:hypothetical protein BVRB_1g015100 isoform A [Beta vulgaris subsp. vulgaris]